MPAAQRVSLQEIGRELGESFEAGLCHEGEVVEVVGIGSIILYRGCLHVGRYNGAKKRHNHKTF